MSDSEQIDELMLRWDAERQQGDEPTAEQLCGDCPHLLEELRRRIRAVQAMEQVFGISNDGRSQATLSPPESGATDPSAELPIVPGYDIFRVIGHGGMGIVYEARQIELARTVAIKMLWGPHLRPAALARFRTEAEAAASLQHPNFVQIFEIGQVNGRPFFSMEYVAGGNLADLLARRPLSPREAAELIETLARAIHAAHQNGVLHRDLKPANVLLAQNDERRMMNDERLSGENVDSSVHHSSFIVHHSPKIADFGLAKRLDDDAGHTHTGEILGTPSYMAPEQAEGAKSQIGPATDIYALGAILYEMLAGRPPFQGTGPMDSLRRLLTHEPVAPSRFSAIVPRDLEAICMKCLEKSPAQRYASAQALAADLRRFLNGAPVQARRVGPLRRMGKWIRRHPQAAGLIAAVVVLVSIPVYFLLAQYQAGREVRLKAAQQAPVAREILHQHCFECHGLDPKKTQRNLNILNYAQLLDRSRRLVVPGAPDDSRLIQRIADGSMPPEEEEIRLPRVSEQELTVLRDWILGGAPKFPAAPDRSSPPAVSYSELAARVKAIFQEHCYECHKSDVAKSGIKILHHRLLTAVRKVVIPGQPDDSELYQLIIATKDEQRMPPAPYPRLSADDIATIREWILEGAAPFPKGR